MSEAEITAIILTIKLALLSTVLLLLLATPLAWWLAQYRGKLKPLYEAIIALPLVLPPTVLGFYLLVAFSPNNFFGKIWLNFTGQPLAFSFSALVIGSIIYSLPFVVQPLQNNFERFPRNLIEAATVLGSSRFDRFSTIIIPLSKRGFITAASLGFAHTVGEFGIVLMIGGNIPGETQVLSILLYEQVETLQFAAAHKLSLGLLISSLSLLSLVYWMNRRSDKHHD